MRIMHCLSSRISHLHRLKQLGPCLWMGQVKSCSVLQGAEDWCKHVLFIASKTPITVCGRRKLSPARPDHTRWLRPLSKSFPELPAPIDSEWCLLCESKQCVSIIFGGNRAVEQASGRSRGRAGGRTSWPASERWSVWAALSARERASG